MLGKVIAGEDVKLPSPAKIAIGLNALSVASRVRETRELAKLNETTSRAADAFEQLVQQRKLQVAEPMDVDNVGASRISGVLLTPSVTRRDSSEKGVCKAP